MNSILMGGGMPSFGDISSATVIRFGTYGVSSASFDGYRIWLINQSSTQVQVILLDYGLLLSYSTRSESGSVTHLTSTTAINSINYNPTTKLATSTGDAYACLFK